MGQICVRVHHIRNTKFNSAVTGAGQWLMPYDLGRGRGVTVHDRAPLSEL